MKFEVIWRNSGSSSPEALKRRRKAFLYLIVSRQWEKGNKNHRRVVFVRFKRQSAILWTILFFDWLPWRDSNTEVWNMPGWKAEYVKSMDHWSNSFILQLNFLAGALHKWTEASLLLWLPQTQGYQCISMGIKTFHQTEPPWGGFSSTDASNQTYNFLFVKLYIVLLLHLQPALRDVRCKQILQNILSTERSSISQHNVELKQVWF